MIIIIIINNNMKKNNDLDKTELKIKNSGYRLTKSRKTILNIISRIKKEITVEDLFILTNKKNSGIGIATIYRTIKLLEKLGIITKSGFENDRAKYALTGNVSFNDNSVKFLKSNVSVLRETEDIVRKGTIIKSSGTSLLKSLDKKYFENKLDNFRNLEKIDRIKTQLNEWATELNKMKREKELELEELITDFEKIDSILKKHEFKKNNLIQVLLDFQTEYNWLPKHVLFYIGSKLGIPLTQIYNIASFYKFFNLEPRGKYQILVCEGTACHVRGSANLLQRIVNILKIKPGDTTDDYKFTLDTVNCLGCCALGPVIYFNKKYFSNPSAKELEKLFTSVT